MPTRAEQLAQHARRVTAAVAFWIVAVLFVANVSLLSGWLLADPATALPGPSAEPSASPTATSPPEPSEPSESAAPNEIASPLEPVAGQVLLDGGAAVTFPGPATRSERFVEIEGEDVALSLHTMTDEDDTTYSVAVIEYPPAVDLSDPAVNLLSSVSGAAGSAGGSVVDQNVFVFEGVPAVEFEIETPNVHLLARNVLAGRRLYSQTVAFSSKKAPEAAEAFFDSFELGAQ